MSKFCYKVRDTATGKFWNGGSYRSVFNDEGKSWPTIARCEGAIAYFAQYKTQWANTLNPFSAPTTWEIVKIELSPVEKESYNAEQVFKTAMLKTEANKVHSGMGYFIDTMMKKKVLNDIEFIFKIKPAAGSSYVDLERIKEARAQLRQLGVKTRSFREYNGMFGMMDRQQALKARLVLDIDCSIDLADLKKRLGI